MRLEDLIKTKTLTFEKTPAEGLEILVDAWMNTKEQLTMNATYKAIGDPTDPNFLNDSVNLCLSKIKTRNLEWEDWKPLKPSRDVFEKLPWIVAINIIKEVTWTTDEKKNLSSE